MCGGAGAKDALHPTTLKGGRGRKARGRGILTGGLSCARRLRLAVGIAVSEDGSGEEGLPLAKELLAAFVLVRALCVEGAPLLLVANLDVLVQSGVARSLLRDRDREPRLLLAGEETVEVIKAVADLLVEGAAERIEVIVDLFHKTRREPGLGRMRRSRGCGGLRRTWSGPPLEEAMMWKTCCPSSGAPGCSVMRPSLTSAC